MITKGALANELAAASNLDAFFGALVGFKFWHGCTFPALVYILRHFGVQGTGGCQCVTCALQRRTSCVRSFGDCLRR